MWKSFRRWRLRRESPVRPDRIGTHDPTTRNNPQSRQSRTCGTADSASPLVEFDGCGEATSANPVHRRADDVGAARQLVSTLSTQLNATHTAAGRRPLVANRVDATNPRGTRLRYRPTTGIVDAAAHATAVACVLSDRDRGLFETTIARNVCLPPPLTFHSTHLRMQTAWLKASVLSDSRQE
jgi:hypothetical protein